MFEVSFLFDGLLEERINILVLLLPAAGGPGASGSAPARLLLLLDEVLHRGLLDLGLERVLLLLLKRIPGWNEKGK